MTTMTQIEKAYHTAASALGIELTFPKEIESIRKRRDQATELAQMKPLNAAHELLNAPNPRQWPSVLDKCAEHNARAEQAQAAVRGGLVTTTTAQVDHALKAHVPQHTDTMHKQVTNLLSALAEAARECPTLDPQHAVSNNYGGQLTAFLTTAQAVNAHASIGSITARADKVDQAARALSLITDPGRIDPIKRTEASRWNHGGEIRSTDAEIKRREIVRGLMSDWLRDPNDTLRKIARGEYQGVELSAATAKTYPHRMTQFENANRTVTVAD